MVDAMIHIRLEERLKRDAVETLAAMGLSISDAVRVLLTRVVAEQQLPFTLRVPNQVTRTAMAEADAIVRAHTPRFPTVDALFDDLDQNGGQ